MERNLADTCGGEARLYLRGGILRVVRDWLIPALPHIENMRSILVENAWPKIAKATAGDRGRRHLAIAYATKLHVRLGRGDILVTNAAAATIGCGETSAPLLAKLLRKGVEIYCLDSLHAKLGVIGRHAFVGSANMSVSSDVALHEGVLVTTDDAIRAQVLATVNGLKEVAQRITDADIKRLLRIKVVRRGGGALRSRKRVADAGHQTWLVGGRLLKRVTAMTQATIDRGTQAVHDLTQDDAYEPVWFRVSISSPMGKGVRPGDRLVRVVAHKRGIDIHPPTPVIHCERSGNHTIAFIDSDEERSVGWRTFSARAAQHEVRISKRACRLLTERETRAIEGYEGWQHP